MHVLLGIYVGCVVVANMTAGHLITICDITFPAGTLLYSVTFLVTDVISEVRGKEHAHRCVMAGIWAMGAVMTYILLVPYFATQTPETLAAWGTLFEQTPRIMFASLLSYSVSQFVDVHIFHALKHKTNGRHLWLRNNVSTMTSQLVDAVVFVTVAFAGTLALDSLLGVLVGQYVAKVVLAALDTPFCYAAVRFFEET